MRVLMTALRCLTLALRDSGGLLMLVEALGLLVSGGEYTLHEMIGLIVMFLCSSGCKVRGLRGRNGLGLLVSCVELLSDEQ